MKKTQELTADEANELIADMETPKRNLALEVPKADERHFRLMAGAGTVSRDRRDMLCPEDQRCDGSGEIGHREMIHPFSHAP